MRHRTAFVLEGEGSLAENQLLSVSPKSLPVAMPVVTGARQRGSG